MPLGIDSRYRNGEPGIGLGSGYEVDGKRNPADVLTKLLDRSEFDVYHQELMYTDADQLRGVRD